MLADPMANIEALQPLLVVPAVQYAVALPQPSHWSGMPLPLVSNCVPKAISHTSPAPSKSQSAWLGLTWLGQLSQSSPMLSPSLSPCGGLDTFGQLSQSSPTASRSASSWLALLTCGQL